MAVITGKCKWASVTKPNTKFEPQYTIDVIVSDAQKKNLENAGLTVKKDKDGDQILKVRRKVASMEGKPFDAPEVVDSAGNPFTKMIGNGSKVQVQFGIYDWEAFGNAGKNAWLNKVTVLEHVPYEAEDEMDFDTGQVVQRVPVTVEQDFDDDAPF